MKSVASLSVALTALATVSAPALAQKPPKEVSAATLLALRERLYVLREARRPDKVLETASKIIEADSGDPWPHFIMAEAYMSFGEHYNRTKATDALKRFLKLAGPNPRESVTGQTVVTRDDRLVAHRYLLRMEDDKPVMLLTPSSVIRKRIVAVRAGIANNQKARQYSEDSIANAEAYIAQISRSGHERARTHIASKQRIISKHRKLLAKADEYLRMQNDELQELEAELQSRPQPPNVRLGNAGRKKN